MTTLISATGLAVSGPPFIMPDAVLSDIGPDKGFAIDLWSPTCFAKQASPANGDPLVNFANKASTRNGSVVMTSGITYTAGKGLYLGGVAAPGNYVAMTSAFEAIQADTNKEWVASLWVMMPSATDWPATARSISGAGNYNSASDLFTLYMTTNTGSKDLIVRVQTAVGATTAIVVSNAGTTFSGKLVQILVWRTAAGVVTVRLKATDGTTQTTTPVTIATNSANLSGLTWRFGTMDTTLIASNFSALGSWNATDIGACKWTLYRAMIASTKGVLSGVTGLTIGDADYARTVARAVYS